MRLTKAGAAAVKDLKEQIRVLKGKLREENRESGGKDKTIEKLERKVARLEKALKSMREEIRKYKRRMRYHEGPSAPGVKNKADRKRDKEARKREEEEERKRGGPGKRRPGAQPGHRMRRRRREPTKRVVIDAGGDRACAARACDGERRVTGYDTRTMVEIKPRPKADVIESQCPRLVCKKCGRGEVKTRGIAVPLHMFRPREGDAEPSRPEGAADGPAADGPAADGPAADGPAADGPAAGPKSAPEQASPAPGPAALPVRAAAVFNWKDVNNVPDGPTAGPKSAPEQASPAPGPAASPVRAAAVFNWKDVNNVPDDPDAPFVIALMESGRSGPNLVAEAAMHWGLRLPFRKSQDVLRAAGADMSLGTVSKMITNAGTALLPGLGSNIDRLRRARIIHADKTRYPVKGRWWNLWIFYDPLNKVAVYWMTRHGDSVALEEILGDWDGIIVCDGAKAFGIYRNKQRCWAHILRESHYLRRLHPGNKRVRYVDKRLGRIFHDAKGFRGNARQRRAKRYEFARRVRALADEYGGDEALREFAVTLDNAAFDLFLFVVDPEVAPTNNAAEQLLREPVIVRKIRGSLRADRSALVMCALLSCTTTWARQGLDPLAELKRTLCTPAAPARPIP